MSTGFSTKLLPLRLAKRMRGLGTELSFETLVRARALEARGRDIVHLEMGEPDFSTPANIVNTGIRALQKGWTHYGPATGLPEIRQAVADYIGRTRQVKIAPEEVVIVPGGNPIIFFAALALIEHGDEIGKLIEKHSQQRIQFRIGSLYPILFRLERRGLVVGRWVEKAGEHRRRYYRLTAEGRKFVSSERGAWKMFVITINRLLKANYA